MKILKPLAKLFVSGVLLTSCASTSTEENKMEDNVWPNGTMYEIFVQSYADSNGDGIGDFNGLTSKLDYIQSLGVQGLWLMPFHPSPSYHKYDVTDYYGIHPDYGTVDDFKNFLTEAHKKNIKVVMDLVVNHTSWEHHWFVSARESMDSPYRDYYVWADIDSVKDQLTKKETTFDSQNIWQWHSNGDGNAYYFGYFYKGMPDLNYDNPKVRKEIIKIGTYWLQEIGVDGFRLDAAGHIYPDAMAKKSQDWWVEFGDAMRKVKPDVYIVGEVWGSREKLASYSKGIRSVMNVNLYYDIIHMLTKEQNTGMIDSLIRSRKLSYEVEPNFTDAIIVDNHDTKRVRSNLGGSLAKERLAYAILLSLPGMPYVYYGDEIGMLGSKPPDENVREPYLWDVLGKDSLRTSWIKPEYSTDSTVVPLALQLPDKESTFHFFQAWINERNNNKTLQTGDLSGIPVATGILAYSRSLGSEKIVALHNLTGAETEVALSTLNCSKIAFCFGENPMINEGKIKLGPYQSVLLK